ncbi:MAG: bifunctional phosphoribosylaminoimidazolecarboxamide formyltransferase/inosine monophosphate cyclohydrolase [Crocinitomicaceae bacterium]|nr:bifunctional phosphoribosylaminoimidazolecarboxamide formyltransferase/inosine monophosphate cyclohydrolase [Crocinitomicaceae bacterium]
MEVKKIKSALISVFSKDGLEPIVRKLYELNVTIYSTGGTRSFIENLGIQVVPVEDLTSYPSILGGRVKTLHPKVFGGILARRELNEDMAQLNEFEIPQLDLVIVDLYPFEKTVASTDDEQTIIEKIDIGGISLIRAAAKNFKDVVIVPSVDQYQEILDLLNEGSGETNTSQRKKLALEAFKVSSHYDSAISDYFNHDFGQEFLKVSEHKSQVLRYGENPHQKGVFYGDMDAIFDKLHGKELSYNNLLDVDAAVALMAEFENDAPTFAVLKHNNACGIATRNTILEAWKDALAGDPVSAFGGVLISNSEVDTETASEIQNLFFEVIIAPSYSSEALEILTQKKNRIVLVKKQTEMPEVLYRSALNGVLAQGKDDKSETSSDLNPVTNNKPTDEEIEDLLFANKLVKHTKSNTIILAKNKQLLASGTGQTSRVDALRQAITKAKAFNFELQGAVMASDAFFPFPDCVEIAGGEGIDTVIQPGGSIKDQLSIDYCNDNNMAMVMTGTRHFKH